MTFSNSRFESTNASFNYLSIPKRHSRHCKANTIASVELSALRLRQKAKKLSSTRIPTADHEVNEYTPMSDARAMLLARGIKNRRPNKQ
jgi:hypothetical protein